MKKKFIFLFFIISSLFFVRPLFIPQQILGITNPAAPTYPDPSGAGGSEDVFSDLLSTLVTALLVFGVIFFVFVLAFGAIKWITAGGDKATILQAKEKITHTLIGVGILLSAFAIFNVVGCFLGIGPCLGGGGIPLPPVEPTPIPSICTGGRICYCSLEEVTCPHSLPYVDCSEPGSCTLPACPSNGRCCTCVAEPPPTPTPDPSAPTPTPGGPCWDSDGGEYPNIEGYLVGTDPSCPPYPTRMSDECSGYPSVYERYCDGDRCESRLISCTSPFALCNDGACRPAVLPPTSTPTPAGTSTPTPTPPPTSMPTGIPTPTPTPPPSCISTGNNGCNSLDCCDYRADCQLNRCCIPLGESGCSFLSDCCAGATFCLGEVCGAGGIE